MCARDTYSLNYWETDTLSWPDSKKGGKQEEDFFFLNIILIFPSFNNQAALKLLFLETLLHCLLEVLCIDPFTPLSLKHTHTHITTTTTTTATATATTTTTTKTYLMDLYLIGYLMCVWLSSSRVLGGYPIWW